MHRRFLWAAGLALIVATSVPTGATAAAATPEAAPREEGFEIIERATYRLDPTGSAVHVDIVTDITNQSPAYSSGGYTRQAYLPRYGLPVLAEATNIVATTADGSPMDVEIESSDNPLFAVAVADISPDLFYPNATTVHFTYDLPSLPPRSEGLSRINAAYAVFPIQSYGDPGLSDVEVIVPTGFEVEMSETQLTKEDRGSEVAYVARAIPDPESFFTVISARNDAALVAHEVVTDDVDITVRAWPGDEAWGAFVADHMQRGIPILKELLGQPWKGDDTLEIIETQAPLIKNYAGWYVQEESLIEINDDLDSITVLHEISHVWFNEDLFNSRWINEAFAETYAREVAQRLGATVEPLVPSDPADPSAVRLNAWDRPSINDITSYDTELYGYNTSLTVLDQIRAEIGYEGLARVIGAAYGREIGYRGDGPPESSFAAPDWRKFLDLLTDVGGSTVAEGLFGTYVVSPEQEATFAVRAASRAAYAALKQQGATFAPPLVVRKAMSDWDFPSADSYMASAAAILATRDQIAATLAPIGVPVPSGLEQAYERAGDRFELATVAQRATELLAAAQLLVAADAKVHQSHGPLERAGIWFGNPGARLRDAKFAFDLGAAARATEEANAAIDAVDDANVNGLKGLVATLVAAGLALRIGRRAREEMRTSP